MHRGQGFYDSNSIVVRMICIAVTGGIACGKSLAASFMRKEGVAVCEADTVAHSLMEPGSDVYRLVIEAFGPSILAKDGSINRNVLGSRVFNCTEELAMLNSIVHPAVRQKVEQWLAAQEASGEKMAAVVIPLLYEAGMATGWDAVLCISASPAVQMARLRSRGLSAEDSRGRLLAQMPVEEKEKRADFVIRNDESPEMLSASVTRVLKQIEERNA